MELVKKKDTNTYTWKGLTLGKLLAIQEGLRRMPDKTGVEYDVLTFLLRQELNKQEPFVEPNK